jgi:GTP-binding protein
VSQKPYKARRKLLKPPSPDISDGIVHYPFVAIIGRPNVGKSTLFNRLIGYRLAITEPTAGTTRDRIAALVHLDDGRTFELCDMGGLGGTGDPHDKDVNRQIDLAMEYADAILLMVDARDGLIPMDQTIARRVKKLGKPMVLVANKADTRDLEITTAEFYQLGVPGDIICTSAREGFGRQDVLDALARLLPAMPVVPAEEREAVPTSRTVLVDEQAEEDDGQEQDADDESDDDESDDDESDDDESDESDEESTDDDESDEESTDDDAAADDAVGADDADDDEAPEEDPGAAHGATGAVIPPSPEELKAAKERILRIAIVGRRNVGKSTYVNQICGEERVIVSDRPGTTRDAVDVQTTIGGRQVVLIDTAGLRKRGKADDHIEIISHGRSMEAIKRADAVLLVLDALDKVGEVDKKLARFIENEHKACVIVANKWDLVRGSMTLDKYAEYVGMAIPGLDHAPVVSISAKTGTHARSPIELAFELFEQALTRVKTNSLNKTIGKALERRRPKAHFGRVGKVYFGTQIATNPVTILLFVNEPELFDGAWLRYMKNRLRASLPWKEAAIKLILRSRSALAKKSGGLGRKLEDMGALADRARWVEDAPVTNIGSVSSILDEDTVRDVLRRTIGRDDLDDEGPTEAPLL